MRRLAVALLALTLLACGHGMPPVRTLVIPQRQTPWALEITPLGTSLEAIDLALGRAIAANPGVVRVEAPAPYEGHVDLTVETAGTPLVDATCTAEVRVVVRRDTGPTLVNVTNHFDHACGWDSHGRDILMDDAIAWALERSVVALVEPPAVP